MKIILDEWIYYFLKDRTKCEDTSDFLNKVMEKCDKLIFKTNSPLINKIWKLSKESQNWIPNQRALVKIFFGSFLKNSKKCELLDQEEIKPLPQKISSTVPRKDIYLIEIVFTLQNGLLITTDRKLKNTLPDSIKPKIKLIEEFLPQYIRDN